MTFSAGTNLVLNNGKRYEIESISKKNRNRYLCKVYTKLGFIGYQTFEYNEETSKTIKEVIVKDNNPDIYYNGNTY